MSDSENKNNINIPEIFSKLALYEQFKAGNEFYFYNGIYDSYCTGCKKESTFTVNFNRPLSNDPYIWCNQIFINFYGICSRSSKHIHSFTFRSNTKTIQKIGQFPSIADLNSHSIKKYSKILNKEDFHEFNKAIGLVSHGVGVGSFVYLRRIFENLIEEAHTNANSQDDWDEELYQKSRMVDKVKLLKDYLPEILVKHKVIYSILSKGIHELTEKECLNTFGAIKLGIELILDHKYEEKLKKQKEEMLTKELSKFNSQT